VFLALRVRVVARANNATTLAYSLLAPASKSLPGRFHPWPERSTMKILDHQLIRDARRFMTGADVHRVKEMIIAYEQAVDLHNRQWSGHEVYQIQSELQLRNYVFEHRMEELKRKNVRAVKLAERTARKKG
jgi:hypothetical protein